MGSTTYIEPMDMIIIIHNENLNIYAIIKLSVYNGSTYMYIKKRNVFSRKENVKEEKMLGKNVKEKCCKVVNLNSFKDQFRNKNFNGMSGPNGRFRLEFCNFV